MKCDLQRLFHHKPDIVWNKYMHVDFIMIKCIKLQEIRVLNAYLISCTSFRKFQPPIWCTLNTNTAQRWWLTNTGIYYCGQVVCRNILIISAIWTFKDIQWCNLCLKWTTFVLSFVNLKTKWIRKKNSIHRTSSTTLLGYFILLLNFFYKA